jgi:RNA polymerase sigma-70 factor (TIGR02943 family)
MKNIFSMTTGEAPPSMTQQVADARLYLLKFARLQLRNDAWAEDAVSETLVAALSKPQSFSGQSQLRTWLVGILKHKVLDILRERKREFSVNPSTDDEADPLDDMAFKPDGHFQEPPTDWGNPDQELQQRQFMAILDACVNKLPVHQGRVFLMREWLEMSTDDICKELALTSTHLYVQLHRARLRLRECLELNWFGAAS